LVQDLVREVRQSEQTSEARLPIGQLPIAGLLGRCWCEGDFATVIRALPMQAVRRRLFALYFRMCRFLDYRHWPTSCYLSRDLRLNRDVAIKISNAQFAFGVRGRRGCVSPSDPPTSQENNQ